MRAKEITVQDLYSGNVVYVTPTFQRSYSHIEKSVRLLISAAKGELESPYFLGALVTRDLSVRENWRKALLIDGNQRLMTLLTLLLALRDLMKTSDPDMSERLNGLCFVTDIIDGTSRRDLKNIVAKNDRAAFESLVSGVDCRESVHQLVQSYSMAKESFALVPSDCLPKIASRLLERFSFVVLELATDDDPYPIFKLFNPQDNEFTRIGRDTYTQFSQDPELMYLIAEGESQEVEFKAHSVVSGKHAKEEGAQGVFTVVRAVAAMLNSSSGGTLLIGVEDNGAICGIENEYEIVDKGKRNWDGYQLYFANTLRAKLSAHNAFLHYQIERRQARGHDVCMVKITPSDEPVYVDKRLYVRTLNQTVEMLGPDLVDYVARRYGKV